MEWERLLPDLRDRHLSKIRNLTIRRTLSVIVAAALAVTSLPVYARAESVVENEIIDEAAEPALTDKDDGSWLTDSDDGSWLMEDTKSVTSETDDLMISVDEENGLTEDEEPETDVSDADGSVVSLSTPAYTECTYVPGDKTLYLAGNVVAKNAMNDAMSGYDKSEVVRIIALDGTKISGDCG